jgi:hypothetical protein
MVLMEILLLLAVVAAAASGLYVAANFNNRTRQNIEPLIRGEVKRISDKIDKDLRGQLQELRSGLSRLEAAERERNKQDQSERMVGLISYVKRQSENTQEQFEHIADRIADIAGHFTTIELEAADLSAAETSSGEVSVTEVSDAAHPLTLAVLEAESNRARGGWDQPPQLYGLVGKAAVIDADPELEAEIGAAPEGSLIPIKQQPLPEGEPLEVLAGVHWPAGVAGCVLVTELVVLPPEAEDKAPPHRGALEQWASDQPGSQPARLAVGVSRDGHYTCILRLQGEESVQIVPWLADDLVTALLETF